MNYCFWKPDDVDGGWDGSCGIKYVFNSDGPKENNFNFCPHCGHLLVVGESPKLVLQRPLCVIDIEATGVDVASDRIITLAVLRIEPPDLFNNETRETRKTWTVHPGRMIPADSTRIHGITDDMVKDCPRFKGVAADVRAMLSDADLCGFNLRNFDVPLLWEEMYRSLRTATDNDPLPMTHGDGTPRLVVDASEIFRKKEPRTLTAAVKKYCGRDHEGAHEAMADVQATWDVLHGQLAAYPELLQPISADDMIGGLKAALRGNDEQIEAHADNLKSKVALNHVAALAELCVEEYEGRPAKRLDLCGYIIEDADGIARYTLKKVRGVPVLDDPGFGEWMLRNSFPAHTCKVLRKLLADYL
ncbi:MAG: 3'-5' exonuclease [Patescibacteria group bacterium]|nr:3'-5' exonuclease [Patescibacteria group bacterium]